MRKIKHNKGTLCITLLGSMAAAALTLMLFGRFFIINGTHSLQGVLFLKKEITALSPDDMVAACPKDPYIRIGIITGSLIVSGVFPSDCNYKTNAVLKIVAALPGDYVEADGIHEIRINGRRFAGSAPLAESILPKFTFSGYLREGEYLLLTHARDGYDGRYWGTLSREQLLYQIIRVI